MLFILLLFCFYMFFCCFAQFLQLILERHSLGGKFFFKVSVPHGKQFHRIRYSSNSIEWVFHLADLIYTVYSTFWASLLFLFSHFMRVLPIMLQFMYSLYLAVLSRSVSMLDTITFCWYFYGIVSIWKSDNLWSNLISSMSCSRSLLAHLSLSITDFVNWRNDEIDDTSIRMKQWNSYLLDTVCAEWIFIVVFVMHDKF